jgi:hypothetical protein
MFVGLARKFVGAQVVALAVLRCGGLVGVRGEQMKFSGASVIGLRHGGSPRMFVVLEISVSITLILLRRKVHAGIA